MSTYQKQEKFNLSSKSLRTFVFTLSLVGAASTTYAEGTPRNEDSESRGVATRLIQAAESLVEDRNSDAQRVGRRLSNEGLGGAVLELFQVACERAFGEKRLELINENTKRARAFLVNQRTGETIRDLGDIDAENRKEVLIDYDDGISYSVRVVLDNFLRSTAVSSPFRLGRNREIVFTKDFIGTTVVVKK